MKSKAPTIQNKSFIKDIQKAIPNHCSNCGRKYTEKDLTLIQKDNYAAVLHLTCSKCKESYLVNVVSALGALHSSSKMPLKIDIASAKEAKKFIGSDPISSDDVLDIHETLKGLNSAKDFSGISKQTTKKN